MPDIALVNPPISQEGGSHPLPYGLWQLGSFVKHHGFQPTIVDLNRIWRAKNSNYSMLKEIVENVDTPIVGFTGMGTNLPTALEFATDLKSKRPDVTIIFGGPHVSFVGRELLKYFPCVDYVVVGEGEITLLEILKARKNGDKIDGISGVLSRNANSLPRPLIKNIDSLPLLDLDVLNLEKYSTGSSKGLACLPLLAGSGRPFQCTFCSTSVMWERKFRVKSPKKLAQEMEWIASQTGVTCFDLIHDIFTANKQFLNSFCEEVLNKDLNWLCSSRIDGLTTKDIKTMAKAGCNNVFFGVESGSQEIQKVIGKRLKVESILPTLSTCLENGIDCVCSTVFGFPEETWDDIQSTVEVCLEARKIGVSRANLHLLKALPGTRIFKECCLSESVESDDFSRAELPIITERSKDWIRTHRELFSSFYWVKHRTISKEELCSMTYWDYYLACHLNTLQTLFEKYKHSFPELVRLFVKSRLNERDPLGFVAHEVFDNEVERIFKEEQELLTIAKYQSETQSSDRHIQFWIKREPEQKLLLFETSGVDNTINIYELNKEDLGNWHFIQQQPLSKSLEMENFWLVKPKNGGTDEAHQAY